MQHTKCKDSDFNLSVPDGERTLPYEKPELGKNFWVHDDFFTKKEALDIANRCYKKKKWKLGKPYTNELWPGMRAEGALRLKELSKVEGWVKQTLGLDRIWTANSDKVVVDSNTAILVSESEGKARPHVDSRKLCHFGAVLYLNINPDPDGGTSFYRLRHSNGAPGGNIVLPPYNNLVDALNTKALPSDAWYIDEEIENKFNRLILFKGNIAHSASKYFGKDKREKRLAVTFFWLTDSQNINVG